MKWLIDEMLPPATATELNALGHDAIALAAAGLDETEDSGIYEVAVEQQRVLVTENFADCAAIVERRVAWGEPCVAIVFVRKEGFRRGRALPVHFARRLHKWATENPDPYPGLHWP